jgi:hypothetical protein
MRWYGSPWPSAELRAPICEDDAYRVSTPVGAICLRCERPIRAGDSGVITASYPEIEHFFLLRIEDDDYLVVAYHLDCFLHDVLGGHYESGESTSR